MSDSQSPHKGIELDSIDLSGLDRIKGGQPSPSKAVSTLNPKQFVKDLYVKIHEHPSFLSFSTQLRDINKILGMKYSSAGDIADAILKDVALTTKLLKLVNSSFYGHFTRKKGIQTVSEAMIILGTQEIKLAAASLKIYEFMKDIATIRILKEKTLKALQRSIIARSLCISEGLKDAEAIQISAMLYDLGQYLVALFAPTVYIETEILGEDQKLDPEMASKKIIGVSYSELGRFIAGKWNLPDTIIYSMNPAIDPEIDKSQLSRDDMQRSICAFTHELCQISMSTSGEVAGRQILDLSGRFMNCLEITPTQCIELLKMSQEKMKTHTRILNEVSS